MNYIGIDLGTSGVKLLLVSADGKILSEVTEEYNVFYPQSGWSEQNPEDWYTAVICGLKRLKAKEVAGISFGGQMHGLVILDKDDNVIRPCILWNDGRSSGEVEYLNSLPLANHTGNIAFAGFTAPKLLWLKNNEPENFKRIDKIMLPKDYLTYKLCGAFVTDYSDASGTLLLDVKNKRWSEEMLEICGISTEKLPKLCESFEKVGVLKPEIAKVLGLEGAAVVAGAGDNAAAAVGTGTVEAGSCNISLGTSGTLFIAGDEFSLTENNAIHSFAHANGKYHLMGCILSAASANKWWIEDILGTDYALPERAADRLGENEVYFLPYLMGERCPHNDVDARGAFIGMTANTSKADMALAVLEGVAFAFRDCLELARKNQLNVVKSTVCGGGTKSRLWLEILANVLNVSLYSVETEKGPSFGAAILAMVACGEYSCVEEAADKIVKKRLIVQPQPEYVGKYEEKYKKYTRLYPALKEFYKS